jgi:hypothetical protein
MYTLASISPPTTMFAAHRKRRALSFQEKDFTPAMQPLVMSLKRHVDEERKNQKAVSTRNPTWRAAQGLGMGELTVKRSRAESRHHGHHREVQAAKSRGKPDYRAAVNRQPVIREDVRAKN